MLITDLFKKSSWISGFFFRTLSSKTPITGWLEQASLDRRLACILARSPARHSKRIVTVRSSYGNDSASTKLERKYDAKTLLMMFVDFDMRDTAGHYRIVFAY